MRVASYRWVVMSMLVGWGLLCGLLPTAWSHSDLDPRQSIPRKWETYTLNVPTETDASTVKVRLLVPEAFEVETIEHSRDWQIDTVRDARGYVREVSWSGGAIPPQTFEEFKLLARNPAAVGTYRWKIEQHYQRGEVGIWEAQTQIVALANTGSQRAEEAWRLAQVATTVSLVAIGIAIVLIIVTVIGVIQNGRARVERGDG